MNNLKLLKFTVLVLLLGIVSTNGLLAQNSPMSGESFNLDLADLDPGQEVIITFDVTVDATIPPNVTQVCNQGLVSGTNFSDVLTDDPDVGGATDPTCTPADPPPPSGSTIVINEVDYDQPGTDVAEFIELKNISDSPIDLTGWTLELVNGTGGGATIYNTITLPGVSLAAGDYFVICGDAANVANCDLDVTPDINLIQNGAPDAIGLRNSGGDLVDAVSYEGDTGAPYTEGSGTGLVDPSTTGNLGISRFPDGTDTDQNNVDFVSSCITPGEPNIGIPSCPTVEVTIDIKPQSCPNPLNVKKKGVMPVAILGTGDFDVLNIDPATVLFEGVAPIRWAIEDVTTPVAGGEQCDCTTDGPDGFDDLTLKFDAQELAAALGSVNNGDELELTITGNLLDGTPIEGSDCVIIKAKNVGKHLTGNSSNVPEEYALFENFPNPFNPSTTIQFAVPEQSFVKLEVYNSLGERVTTLVAETLAAGIYSFNWNAINLPSGVYIYSIQSKDFFENKKMILMK